MPIRAVILDIGGVLEVNPRTGWQDRWADVLGLERGALDAKLAPILQAGSVGTITLEQVSKRLQAALDLDCQSAARLLEDRWREYLGTLNHELATYFASLRPQFRTGIISNSFVGAREREQAAYGFAKLCDTVIYSHEQGLMKPSAELYLLACRQLGVAPAETAFVDDVAAYVEAAAALGIHAIRFDTTAQTIAALERELGRAPLRP